jgi:hypothetical protein
VRTIGLWVMGALLASALSGCCCCGGCAHSPIPYSEGNPYECGSCCFWGVGYYMQLYGFLRRPCPDPCDNCQADWTTISPSAPVPASTPVEAPKLPMPVPAVTPYDAAPPVPAAPDETEAPDPDEE